MLAQGAAVAGVVDEPPEVLLAAMEKYVEQAVSWFRTIRLLVYRSRFSGRFRLSCG